MPTANDIIKLSLKNAGVIGIGQTPSAEDTNDTFNSLNFMLAQWQVKRWLVYHLVDVSFVSNGSQSYTVGVGQQFNTPSWVDRIESAFFRQLIPSQPNQIDYPLEILESRETYNQISLKTLTSFPMYVFYDSSYPVGHLFPWPIPTSIYEVHISVKEVLPQFTSLAQNIVLPPTYYAAILYNLTTRNYAQYNLPPNPITVALAKDSLALIRGSNAQIPRLIIPNDLIRPGIYNVYSDIVR